jgi:hypothetical protein
MTLRPEGSGGALRITPLDDRSLVPEHRLFFVVLSRVSPGAPSKRLASPAQAQTPLQVVAVQLCSERCPCTDAPAAPVTMSNLHDTHLYHSPSDRLLHQVTIHTVCYKF